MQYIRRYENCLLVTTRTHLRRDLAEQLGGVPVLNLLPFTEENQIEFLTKFWKSRASEGLNEEDFAVKARLLLEKFKSSLVQKQIFLEIPLQLFMLADVTTKNPGVLNIDFRLFSLYERFIKNKTNLWIRTLLALNDISSIILKQFDVILFHQRIAIGAIYGRKVVDSLQLLDIPQSWAKEVVCRVGFLHVGVSGDFQFAHQTFGDYFIAQMLLNSITTELYAKNFKILHELFVKVLVGSSNYDENIRNFMNEKLNLNEAIFHKTEMTETLEENLNVEANLSFLIRLVEKKQFNLINLVLKNLKISDKMKTPANAS